MRDLRLFGNYFVVYRLIEQICFSKRSCENGVNRFGCPDKGNDGINNPCRQNEICNAEENHLRFDAKTLEKEKVYQQTNKVSYKVRDKILGREIAYDRNHLKHLDHGDHQKTDERIAKRVELFEK